MFSPANNLRSISPISSKTKSPWITRARVIRVAKHQKGRQIPEGWAYDEQGRPTTDPVAAIGGLIQPIGQHKGIGLAVVMGMLSSLLSGASYGTELGDMTAGPKPGHDGHFFAALEISAFQPLDEVKARVEFDQPSNPTERLVELVDSPLSARPARGRIRELL